MPVLYMTPEQAAAEMLPIISDPAQAIQAAFLATVAKGDSPTLQDFALCARLVSKYTTTDEAVEIVHSAWDAEERRRLYVKMPTQADILRALTTRETVRIIKKRRRLARHQRRRRHVEKLERAPNPYPSTGRR